MGKVSLKESQIQQAIIEWVDAHIPTCPALKQLFATPNGGKRSPRYGARLRKEGMRKGVPDLVVLAPGILQGVTVAFLVMEVKTEVGRLTPEQKEWLPRCAQYGGGSVVVRSVQQAVDILKAYFQIP